MYNNKNKILFATFALISFLGGSVSSVFAQTATVTKTANDFSSYVPFTGTYDFGSNMGYYGSQFTDQDIAQLAYNSGSHTIRPSLPDWLITGYGTTSRLTAFQAYQAMGMKDITAFVGEPNEPTTHAGTGPDDRETMTFPGADERAETFEGIYQPVWLDAAKTKINPANTFANYLYKTVNTYGPYVKFWEIINEPDFTYGSNGWADSSQATSWWNVNPTPDELSNLKAPIFYYIRELRVAYDVIKTLQPNEYVATGGIGYPSFLDAMLRNTDNPVDGSVTAQYPLKGGAYFDVLSFHSYPMYSLRHWSNTIMDFIYTRNSDAAVDVFFGAKNDFNTVLKKYGYDGTTYPQKQWMSTETDLPQSSVADVWGSQDSADNYIMKVHILAQANGMMEIYKYGLGENGGTPSSGFDVTGVYGNITPASTTIANAPKTPQFKATKTLDDLLTGKTYDAAKTAQLNLPSTVRGAAFKDSNNVYTYALWAETSIDESETASATYTFPFPFSGTRSEWDFSATNQTTVAGQTVTLAGSPSFFIQGGSSTNQNTNQNTNTVSTSTTQRSNIGQNYYAPPVPYVAPQIPTYNYVTPPVVTQQYTPATPLVVAPTAQVTSTQTPTISYGKISTIATLLNVRVFPNGKIITQIPFGTTGTMTDQKKVLGTTWANILFDSGISGWISARYMKAQTSN